MGRQAGYGGGNRFPLVERIFQEFAKMPGEDMDLMSMDLTEDEKTILDRWIFIDNLIRRHRPKLKITDIEVMTRKRYGISSRQFYIDYKNTDRLFGTQYSLSKDYARSIYVEHLEQLATLAEASNDFKSAIKALEVAAKLRKLDLPDEEEGEPEPNKFLMVFINNGGNELGSGEVEVLDLEKLKQVDPEKYNRVMQAVDQPLVNEKKMEQLLDGNLG